MKKIKQIIVITIAILSITSCNSVSSIYYGSKSDVRRNLENTEWSDRSYSSSMYCTLNIGKYSGGKFDANHEIKILGDPARAEYPLIIKKIKHPQTGLRHYALAVKTNWIIFIPDTGEFYIDEKLIATLRKK